MTRRALPLLVDALPLYATEHQLVGALATGEKAQNALRRQFWTLAFPRESLIAEGLFYVPAVLAYFADVERARVKPRESEDVTWNRPPVYKSGADRTARKSPTGSQSAPPSRPATRSKRKT